MYSVIQYVPIREILKEYLPSLVMALIIAEVFYKFKSFSLESIAFLATWFALNYLIQLTLKLERKHREKKS